jgi:hypothetical protein
MAWIIFIAAVILSFALVVAGLIISAAIDRLVGIANTASMSIHRELARLVERVTLIHGETVHLVDATRDIAAALDQEPTPGEPGGRITISGPVRTRAKE